ncbi:MAG: HdeA family protein [Thiobacillaceae bacterium]|jgi:hypothetical protein|nr:HdeA family protein [Thiobacillaceae bacterium]
MITRIKSRFFSLIAVAVLGSQPMLSQADTPSPAPKDAGIDQLDCRTLLRLGGDDRDYTLLYFHGFVSGKNNQTRLEIEDMAMATDQVVEHCIDHPKDNLLPVFEKYRKAK